MLNEGNCAYKHSLQNRVQVSLALHDTSGYYHVTPAPPSSSAQRSPVQVHLDLDGNFLGPHASESAGKVVISLTQIYLDQGLRQLQALQEILDP